MKYAHLQRTLAYLLIALYLPLFQNCQPADNGNDQLISNNTNKVTYAKEFGLLPNDTLDQTYILQKLLAHCQQNAINELIFEQGTYHFHPEKALEKYCAITNNDNGLKKIAFPLLNFKNFEINGHNSKFIFHGVMIPFVIENSQNIKLNNFSIDWDQPFYGQGEVINVSEKEHYFDLSVTGEFDYEIHSERIYFTSSRGLIDIQKNLWFSKETGGTVYRVNDFKIKPWDKWVNDYYHAKELKKGVVRVFNQLPKQPKKGWIWVAKGGQGARLAPAMRVFKTSELSLSHVNIHHSGAMGIIAERSENILLTACQFTPSPNSKRMVSTSADATHFANCRGMITLENCLFENMLDDATNVHGTYVKVVKQVDQSTLGYEVVHGQQKGFLFAEEGDTIQIVDSKTLSPIQRVIVANVKHFNETYSEITFKTPFQMETESSYVLENISWTSGLTMKNCTVQKNRARGILISTPKKVMVENNTFSNMMAGICISGDANYRYESGAVQDITISKNKFINCCTGGKGNTTIMIAPIIKNLSLVQGKKFYHRNIKIEDNHIETFDQGVLFALGVHGISFSNNKITQSNQYPAIFPTKPNFEILNCQEIDFINNEYTGKTKASIKIDQTSKQRLNLEKNEGFQKNLIEVTTDKNPYSIL